MESSDIDTDIFQILAKAILTKTEKLVDKQYYTTYNIRK